MNNSFNLYLFILLLISVSLSGQTINPPKVVPPSPQAQEFMKYVDYPVDYSTGIPKNEIPIYTINCGELSLPITISYNSSGLIPSEESGKIGLGWSLNYGGNISRVMKGCPDERFYNTIIPTETDVTSSASPVLTTSDPYYGSFASVDVGGYDSEYDIFYYSLPNQSGRFIFDRNSDINTFIKPILLPYHPIKIIPQLSGSGNNLSFEYFNVLDEKGNLYRFGESLVSGQQEFEDYRLTSTPTTAQSGKSAWLLTQIISADKADTIHFEYEYIMNSKSVSTKWIAKLHHVFTNTYTEYLGGGGPCSAEHDSWGSSNSFSAYEYSSKRIKTIKFKHNELRFTYKDDHYPNSLLTKIEIYDYAQSKITKTINLSQSKYHTNSSRLNWDKLDNISFYGELGQLENKYTFEYNTSVQFPQIQDSYSNETYSVDYWGYYNGASNTANPIPPNAPNYTSELSGTADRNPNPQFSQAGILTKITFPTGGDATFFYGGNKIGSNSVGGVRIDSIILNSGSARIKKAFEYNDATAIGISYVDPIYSYSRSLLQQVDVCPNPPSVSISYEILYATYSYSSDLVSDINLNGRPVTYTEVTEYLGDKTTNNGKIEHYYNTAVLTTLLSPDFLPTPIRPLDKVHWESYPIDYFQRYLKYGDLLENKTIYYNSLNNPVKEIDKSFSNTVLGSFDGLKVRRQATVKCVAVGCGSEKIKYFAYSTYTISQLAQQLDNVITYEYYPNQQDPFTTNESYTYNNYLLPSSKTTDDSQGKHITVDYRYPSDINSGIYSSMVSLNMLNYPIEQTKKVDVNIIASQLNTYKLDQTHYVSDKVFSLETTTPLSSFTSFNGTIKDSRYGSTPELSFDNYDSGGNLLSISKKDGIITSYCWGYNQTYPVIKAENIDYLTLNSALTSIHIGLEAFLISIGDLTTDPQKAALKNFNNTIRNLSILSKGQITTYTYNPLVGMTSSTDPSGVSTYYEYDTFGRLKLIKDDDGHILKTYEYHYKP